MKSFSGCCKLKEFSGSTESIKEIIESTPIPKSTHSDEYIQDNYEIEYIMKTMQNLEKKDPDLFSYIMEISSNIIKLITDIDPSSYDPKELVKSISVQYSKIEAYDKDYVFWIGHKCIKLAIEKHLIEVLHFFIIIQGFKLRNKCIYQNTINNYIKSLSSYNFIDGPQLPITKYVSILQLLIFDGDCDPNDNEKDEIENSPLHYAVALKQLQFFIVLIKYKYINVNKVNQYGETPLDFAVENVIYGKDVTLYKEFAKLLIEKGGECRTMESKIETFWNIIKQDEESEDEKEEVICTSTQNTNPNPNVNKKEENSKENKNNSLQANSNINEELMKNQEDKKL